MGRPFTASDEDVLQAAARVLLRRGPDGFSVAEVASEVGIGRTAIILRFKSTHDLKMTLLTKMVERFAGDLAKVPKISGGDGLLQLGAFIGSYLRSRENGARFFANFSSNLQHRDLIRLEERRGEFLRQAIAEAMPKLPIDRESAVTAFMAHLTGSIIAWLSLEDPNPGRYLVMRTREWLKLANIPFNEKLAKELAASQPDAVKADPMEPKPASSKAAVRAKKQSRDRR
jgi:AcrR family transcriptional regulator